MKKYLLLSFLLLQSQTLQAGLVQFFKDEEGRTNWQYVANWSSGILIILLSVAVINLFLFWRRAQKSNRELKAIRKNLEVRVRERTATLDESNRLLKKTNQLLETEVAEHRVTTERLEASESYIRNILRSMPLMLVGLDKEGNITQWNKKAEDVSGIEADKAIGRNLWELYPSMTVSPRLIEQVLEKNEAITVKQSQPGTYHFDITAYPLQGNQKTGVVVLVDDVTKRVEAENMLIHHDKMSSMGELASTMAHDLNRPLQGILLDLRAFHNFLANSKLLQQDVGQNGEVARLSGLLNDAAEKGQEVESVIENLLRFARGRTDKRKPALIPDIMDHSLELANEVLAAPSKLRFRDIRVIRQYEDNLPLLPCYVTELQQAFLGLFRHACDALALKVGSEGFEPTIKIQINKCYDAIWIKLQHNGVGLSGEEQMYLFEPYFSDHAPQEEYDAGKRLSFSYYVITEQHQGHMAVTSDVKVGTTFHIELQL
ncbi:MAG: PAS domain S-box protein [Oceanospirillaceae bacterium]|nr:PAS domain S-box protein [Oceanospirillaceae bacterium]